MTNKYFIATALGRIGVLAGGLCDDMHWESERKTKMTKTELVEIYRRNDSNYDRAVAAAAQKYPLGLIGSYAPSEKMIADRKGYSDAVDAAIAMRRAADAAANKQYEAENE